MQDLGQLFITGIEGYSLSKEEQIFLEDENIGGVLLRSENFEAPAQLAELINSIQKLRDEYPLFIAIDQKTLKMDYLKKHFSQFPSFRELANFQSPKLIYEVYDILAKEMSACGINLCLGPVCDLHANPENKNLYQESFGEDPQFVSKLISASIRGLQTKKVLSSPKYFPGHGLQHKDSAIPLIKKSIQELEQTDLIPFQKASKARAEFMMIGHMIIEELDPDLPASLSPKGGEFLRQMTKFSKLILTDNLPSLGDRYSVLDAAFLALKGEADIVLIDDFYQAKEAYNRIKYELKTQNLSKEKMLTKMSRIRNCKKDYFSTYAPIYIPQIVSSFHSQDAQELLNSLQERISANA